MSHLLLLTLLASGITMADDGKWSVGQTPVSPEYVFCKPGVDCMARTDKVVDVDTRPALAARGVASIPIKQTVSAKPLTVQFRLASSVLDEKARADLDRLIESAGPRQKYLVTGMTDKLGSARFNKRLARFRAGAVRKYLVRNGVPAASIVLSASCCVDFPPTDNPPARRAVIRLSDPENTR